jgi:hypothetical protein
MLDILKVVNSKYSLVKVSGSGVSLEGVLQNDLGVSGQNDFDTGFMGSEMFQGVLEKKAELQRTITLGTGGAAGADTSGTIQEMTKLNWTGSQKPLFTVEIALVALKDDATYDVVKKSMQAMKCVYPNKKLGVFEAPLGYNPGNAAGTLNLTIGKWFRARNLVMRSANFTYSRVCLKSGKPLYALGSVTLEPYQAITYGEFRSYFRI